MSGVRKPAVAGRFYEGTKEALEASLRECFEHSLGPGSVPEETPDGPALIDAVVSPHAGYMFSGPAAAHGFAALAADGVPEAVVIVGPSHYVPSRHSAVSLADAWRTPLGDLAVDRDLGTRLADASPFLSVDEQAHGPEHSLEVQLPFLQYVYPGRTPRICPICVCPRSRENIDQIVEEARAIGETIARTVASIRAVVIASTDFSHQVPHDTARRLDRMALDAILALDPEALLRTVSSHGISMCGPVPVAIALAFCRERGANQPQLLRYYTSGDIIGDRKAVVGYASLVVRRTGGGRS